MPSTPAVDHSQDLDVIDAAQKLMQVYVDCCEIERRSPTTLNADLDAGSRMRSSVNGGKEEAGPSHQAIGQVSDSDETEDDSSTTTLDSGNDVLFEAKVLLKKYRREQNKQLAGLVLSCLTEAERIALRNFCVSLVEDARKTVSGQLCQAVVDLTTFTKRTNTATSYKDVRKLKGLIKKAKHEVVEMAARTEPKRVLGLSDWFPEGPRYADRVQELSQITRTAQKQVNAEHERFIEEDRDLADDEETEEVDLDEEENPPMQREHFAGMQNPQAQEQEPAPMSGQHAGLTSSSPSLSLSLASSRSNASNKATSSPSSGDSMPVKGNRKRTAPADQYRNGPPTKKTNTKPKTNLSMTANGNAASTNLAVTTPEAASSSSNLATSGTFYFGCPKKTAEDEIKELEREGQNDAFSAMNGEPVVKRHRRERKPTHKALKLDGQLVHFSRPTSSGEPGN